MVTTKTLIGRDSALARAPGGPESGCWVVLAGLSPAETVATAEALLARGVWTVVDTGRWPVLGQALGRRRWGIHCVVLSPVPPARATLLALRLRDVVVAGVALLLLAPSLGVVAPLIKRSSPGPVFFTTRVVGRDGRLFTWRKLRTMRVGSPSDDAQRRERYQASLVHHQATSADGRAPRKIVDEARVTGIGRVLRRHSLDELPQIWNVLKGDMALVGPRPCLAYEYELQAPWQRLRFRSTPGLTGPWQAYGRSRVTIDEMALMDYCYGYTRSFWLDVRLILRTLRVVVSGEGGK